MDVKQMGQHRDWHVTVLSRSHDGNGDVFERLYMDPDLENGAILHPGALPPSAS